MGPGCGCATAMGAAGAIGAAITGGAITGGAITGAAITGAAIIGAAIIGATAATVGTAAITAVGVHTWRWSQGQQQTNGNIKIPMRIVMGPQYCCCVCVVER